MKSTRSRRTAAADDDMPAEYALDWSKARPNPYAARLKDKVTVVLAPDVAEAFPTSESVDNFLRVVLAAVPKRSPRRGERKRPEPSRRGGPTNRRLSTAAGKRASGGE